MNDYLSLSKSVYIKKTRYGKLFHSYDYNNQHICACAYKEYANYIEMNVKIFSNNLELIIESIDFISEILFFLGQKSKDVRIFNSDIDFKKIGYKFKNNIQIKTVESFENERKTKSDTINDVYLNPKLVPWNLVPREWDVIDLVNKFLKKNDKLLEIGSGLGKNLLAMDQLGFKNLYGIENSKNACDLSYNFELCKKINLLGDITNNDYSDCEFDAVVDIGCLHCIPDFLLVDAITQVSRILKPKGKIISRFFLTKDKKWLDNFPLKVNNFGKQEVEIVEMFSKYFNIVFKKKKNGCIYIIGEKL